MDGLPDIGLIAVVLVAVSAFVVLCIRLPRYALPALITLGVLTSRPTWVGEPYPVIGTVILTLCAIACIVLVLIRRTPDQGGFHWPFAIFVVAWLWLGVHKLLVSAAEKNFVSSTFSVFMPVVLFYFVVRDRDLLLRTRNALVLAVVIVSTLTAVASAAILLAGPSAVSAGSVPLGYVGSSLGVYLPGSLSYGTDAGSEFPRMLGVGREPGMGALFIGWAFFAMPDTFRWKNILKIILVVSLIATQSTAGIGLFGACYALSRIIGGEKFSAFRAVFAAVVGSAVVYLAVYSPAFGLVAKSTAPGDSYSARNDATALGLKALFDQPFTANYSGSALQSINLVAQVAVSGAPWLILMVLFLASPILRGGRRQLTSYSSLFILLTMLTSQPLAGSVGIFVLTLLNYYSAEDRHTRLSRPPPEASEPGVAAGTRPLLGAPP